MHWAVVQFSHLLLQGTVSQSRQISFMDQLFDLVHIRDTYDDPQNKFLNTSRFLRYQHRNFINAVDLLWLQPESDYWLQRLPFQKRGNGNDCWKTLEPFREIPCTMWPKWLAFSHLTEKSQTLCRQSNPSKIDNHSPLLSCCNVVSSFVLLQPKCGPGQPIRQRLWLRGCSCENRNPGKPFPNGSQTASPRYRQTDWEK